MMKLTNKMQRFSTVALALYLAGSCVVQGGRLGNHHNHDEVSGTYSLASRVSGIAVRSSHSTLDV